MIKSLKWFVLCFTVALILFIWTAATPGPLKTDQVIVINKGSLLEAADQLKEQGVISNKLSFVVLAKLANYIRTLKAGEYAVQEGSSILNLLYTMQSGKVFKRAITIPEGYTTTQILEAVEQNPYLVGLIDKNNYSEGRLLPETYFFIRGEARGDLLNRMSTSMERVLDEAWTSRDQSLPLKDKSELLILASIVEKEAKMKDERPIIASVFINRLRKKMKLDSDPTTIYSITKGKYPLARLLTRKDLQHHSPFNTYFAIGLPPTPIANPGLSSIKATAAPAQSNYLFFVVKDCQGSHNFSAKLSDHIVYVKQYRKLKCKYAYKDLRNSTSTNQKNI
jgi:UPF0755 protein